MSPDTEEAQPYSPDDFVVKPEWGKLFADDDHFSTTSGKELYQTMCQACHMNDGQGASGAGDYPSFVGDERLRSPDYPIDVVLNGLRGMPLFSDKLSDQQIADVVNYLRTNFGNQLNGNTTADDVARVRH
jgi:mono/diheme cytochrome c family protein